MLFNGLALLSLVLAVGATAIWLFGPWVQYKNLWTARQADGYHMLRLDGRAGIYTITLLTPKKPEPLQEADRKPVQEWLGQLSNDDIEWSSGGSYPVARHPPPERLRLYVKSIFPQLFEDLSDERKLGAAHVLLCNVAGDGGDLADVLAWQTKPGYYFGLSYNVRPDGTASYDPSQIPELREQWRRWLIQPTWSMTFTMHPTWLLIVPAIWAVVRLRNMMRRRRARLAGCCPNCHYDLTGNTSGVCPECGLPVLSAIDRTTTSQSIG
jgi:hypothetical protein